MNIDGANLSILSGKTAVGSGAASSSAKTSVDNGFANTFKDQMERSKTARHQADMSHHHALDPQKKQLATDRDKLQANTSEAENVVAQPDKQPSSPTSEQTTESTLAALSEMLNPNGTETANQQNTAQMMAFNGLPMTTPSPEKPAQGLAEGDLAVDDIAPNKTVAEPAKTTPATALPSLDHVESIGKASSTDTLSMPASEQSLPDINPPGMNPQQQAIENKTELVSIARPLNHPGWSKDLGEQIIWLYNKAIASAEITLNPEHLGPVSVRVNVDQDQASIQFIAQHTATKDLLEASIPKLREMLSQQQINLADVNVSQNPASHQHSQPQDFAQTPEQWGQTNEEPIETAENTQPIEVKGLLSLYA